MLKTALQYSHQLLEECVTTGDKVIDATMGNGYDTIFLSKLVGKLGYVYAFDIQKKAIQNTQDKILEQNIDNVSLIFDSHANFKEYFNDDFKIKAAIFNLGYLPNGDKSIITKSESTIQAIQWLLTHLEINGRIILVVYHGHEGGKKERDDLLSFVETLDQTYYQVLKYQFLNQKNNPPLCICINKLKNKTKS